MKIRSRLRVLTAICVAALVVGVSPVEAAKNPAPSKKAEQIRSLREQVEEASETEGELLDRFDAARSQRRELDARVAEVDAALAKEQAGLDEATRLLDAAQADLVGAQLRLDRVRGDLGIARDELRRRALASYIGQPGAQAANVFLRVRTISELSATRVYLHAVVRTQSQVVRRLRALQAEAEQLEATVETTRAEAKAYYDQFAQRTQRLQDARAEEEALRVVALQAEQQEASLLEEARSRKHEFEAEIAALQGDSRSLEALLRARQSGPAAPAHAGTLSSPIPFAVVTSRFGPRMHPILGTVRMHTGLDIRADFGTPILAAADGEVVWAGPRGGYGNMTVIDHGSSLATGYGHQQTIIVQVGQQVTRGQVIGMVGSTGMSTGPHLHFEVRVNGAPVDPLGYL